MKRSGLSRTIVAIAMMLIGWLPSLAHDFEVDGVYYDKINSSKVEVTYKGNSSNSYFNEYAGDVVIPSSVDYNGATYSVTSIGDDAFNRCSSLTSIEIPNSVTSIGDYAFYECTSLASIEIPNSVTSIGGWAFAYCSSLTSVIIGNSVTSIGSGAFADCTSLTSIKIPNSVTSIGEGAFRYCSSLTSIVVDSGNTKYDSRNGCNAIIETASNTLIAGCQNTIIPNSVTSIGEGAFAGCSSLTSIQIPNSVTSIGDWAFAGCSGLTSIEIPNSVTSIGEGAFRYCSSLTSIEIPNSVTSIGDYAFEDCTSLTSIEIPNSVTSIGVCAFEDCTSLTSVEIGNSVTSIGNSAFFYCSSLTSIEIGNSVTSIGGYAFYECSSLTSVEIGNSVTSIGGSAFFFCSSLTSIQIPNSVTSIGDAAFSGCSSLTSIVVDSDNSKYDSRNDCNAIIETASNTLIAGCQNTIIPNSVTSIGSSAFSHCISLKSIEIPNSVTSIGDAAFWYCSSLTSIQIPNSVKSIGDYAFEDCTSLTSIEIPNSVTSIGRSTFASCSSLTSVVIGNSVKSIGDYAFGDCSSLTKITCLAKNPPTIKSDTFNSYSAELYVPAGCISAYKSANYWKNFNIKEIPTLSTSIALNKTSASLKVTETLTLVATVLPENATDKSVTWKSSNEAVATVDANGKVTAVAVGEATITATTADGSNLSASCKVTVYEEAFTNFLSGKTVNTYSGASERVSVEMTNEQAITAFQCDIYLPDGISVATIDGEYDINLSSRAKSSHSLSCVEQSDGSIRLLCYSMSLATFSGNEGELFDINFNISKEIEGEYQVLIDNIVLTDKAQNEYKSSTTIDFNVKAYVPADVNNDGSINVTDVVATASYILGLDTKKFIFEAADMNKDGVINVTDIVGIASVILNGGSASNVSAQRCAPNSSDVIKIEDFAAGKNQSQQVAIEMTNASDYSAFQMDIRLPKGMSIAGCELASAATDHMVAYRELPDGAMRVLVYSLTCRTLPDSEEGIIRLCTTTDNRFEGGEIVMENILFADRGQNEYRLYDSVANVNLATGVSTTDMDCVVYAENRSIMIISPCDQQATITSVDGVSRTYTLIEGRNEIKDCERGIYIIETLNRINKLIIK